MARIETPQRIEPTRLEEISEPISDALTALATASAKLGTALHYSNLIEGHTTRPRDIERALQGEFDEDVEHRNLQAEAAAHVRVQAEIDRMAAEGGLPEPASRSFILRLHRDFYKDAPQEMLRIRAQGHEFLMEPGKWRSSAEHDVAVGRHPALQRARRRFHEVFRAAVSL